MLKAVEINNTNAENNSLKQLYDSAFPEEEQMLPYNQLIHIRNFLDLDYTAYYDNDILVGMTMVFILPRYNFGAYFAVREDLRGKGYGKKILTALLEKYSKGKPFIVGAQSPLQTNASNLDIRKRRHAFYLREGLRDTGIYYTDDEGKTYTIMRNSNEPFTQKDKDETYSLILSACEKCQVNNINN